LNGMLGVCLRGTRASMMAREAGNASFKRTTARRRFSKRCARWTASHVLLLSRRRCPAERCLPAS
jgi:hypothetical protein